VPPKPKASELACYTLPVDLSGVTAAQTTNHRTSSNKVLHNNSKR